MNIVRKFAFLLCFIALISCMSCKKNDKPAENTVPGGNELCYAIDPDQIDYDAEKTNITRAVYTGNYTEDEWYVYLEFKVIESIRGETEDDFLHLAYHENRFLGIEMYEKGQEYLLETTRFVNVNRDFDLFLPINEQSYLPATSTRNFESNCRYYRELEKVHPHELKFLGQDYIRSDDINVIAENSQFVFKIKVKEKTHQVPVGAFFTCEIIDSLKGQENRKEIDIVLKEDAVTIGREYIVFVTPTESGSFFIPTSKHSVYSTDDTESIAKIMKAL